MVAVTVGQVGLGKMGLNVAKCLIDEGFDVVGYDVDPDAVAEFEEHGGGAPTPTPTSPPPSTSC